MIHRIRFLPNPPVISPSDLDLGPGQSADADLRLYIDLTNVENPQPIRGGQTGPTEPGSWSVRCWIRSNKLLKLYIELPRTTA
jgi:hypothetical protein